MTEPRRLREEGPEALRGLLAHAPRTRNIGPDERMRSRARLARTAAGIAVGAGTLAWLQGAAVGAGLGLLAVGAAQVVPAWVGSAPSSAPAVTTPAPARATPAPSFSDRSSDAPPPPPAAASAEQPAPRPAPVLAAPPGEQASADPAVPAPPAPADTLAEEAALLERARAALAGSPADALALTLDHASRFPGGKLSMERELLAIEALRRLGRAPEARARAEALLSRAQGGLYEERLRKLLDGLR